MIIIQKNCAQVVSKAVGLAAIIAGGIGLFPFAGQAADEAETNATVSDMKTNANAPDPLSALRVEANGVQLAYAAYQKMTDADKQEKLWTVYMQTNDSMVPRIIEGVREHPNSPLAFGLLEWVVTNGRISARTLRPYGLQAIELLRDHFTAQTNISDICRDLAVSGDPLDQATIEFLQMASTNNPDRSAQGYATFALARLTKQKAEDMVFIQTEPPSTNAAAQKARAEFLDKTKNEKPESVFNQAEDLFEAVTKNYSDVPNFVAGPGLRKPEPTLGKQASIELYAVQHLTAGKTAPEIQGEDIDGHKFKLSDSRGKVVVISFWASWCGPCMQMVPHERELAQRLARKPFAVIGVNGDSEKKDAKKAVSEQNMTWQSFWNGGSEGGIPGTWNVHSWPTVYILDSKGMIRLKFEGYGGKRTDAMLDAEVDQLLEEGGGKM